MAKEKKKIVFIVNPISGTSGKKFVLRLIDEYLDRNLYDYEVVKTERMGHATELAREAVAQKADIVCSIGGDGTVNEVASGLIHTRTALAIIPSGSGNGLARHLRIPTDPLSAIKILNRGLVQEMDYGTVNGKPFFCTCGVGFDAFISQKFAESGKRGPVSYLENVLN
jgi:diacylglycerol kinase family enzyme